MLRGEKAALKLAYHHPHTSSPPEHLPPVPHHKPFLRITFFPLRQGSRLTIEILEQLANDTPAVYRRRSLDAHIFIQTNGSSIKSLMVNHAERRVARDFTGVAMLPLFDMGHFQGGGDITMAHIETAGSAFVAIGIQHLLAEIRVTLFMDLLQIKSYLFSQFSLNTLWEMRLKDLMGEGIDQPLISVEQRRMQLIRVTNDLTELQLFTGRLSAALS